MRGYIVAGVDDQIGISARAQRAVAPTLDLFVQLPHGAADRRRREVEVGRRPCSSCAACCRCADRAGPRHARRARYPNTVSTPLPKPSPRTSGPCAPRPPCRQTDFDLPGPIAFECSYEPWDHSLPSADLFHQHLEQTRGLFSIYRNYVTLSHQHPYEHCLTLVSRADCITFVVLCSNRPRRSIQNTVWRVT